MVDVDEVEAMILRLPHVTRCRVVKKNQRITEVHVVADTSKDPRVVVRDIETVVYATLGLRLDRRIIGVVCLEPDDAQKVTIALTCLPGETVEAD